MPWIDDELYDEKKLGDQGSHFAASVDRAERFTSKLPGIGLCFKCSHATIFRSARQNDPTIRCDSQTREPFMPPDIVECNRFQEVGKLSLSQMAQMAKSVGDPEQRKAGFIQRFSLPEELHNATKEG